MIIPETDYKITQNDVPVLTRTDDGKYVNTNCLLSNFYIYSRSEKLANILTGFGYKDNIVDSIKQYGYSPVYTPVLRILTNYNLLTPNFNARADILAVALFLDRGKNDPTWGHYFEVNPKYRHNVTETQKYTRVGESALKSFQQEYIHQGIECRSTFDAMHFYFKYGFERADERECYLRWAPQR